MANKKLKVELELETAKAKRQAKELEQATGAGGSPAPGGKASPAADRMADALDKASKSAGKSAESLGKVNSQALQLTKGFAGIAVGMAASYAANYATGGTKTALQYGGGILSGASAGATMGMAAGPYGAAAGAIVGGLAGGVKTYMDRDAAQSAVAKEYREGEERYAAAKDWEAKFRDITGIGQNKQSDFITDDDERLKAEMEDTAKHLEDTKANINILNGAIGNLKASLETMIRNGDTDSEEFKKLSEDLQDHRSRLQSLESAEQALERETHQQKVSAAKKQDEKDNDRGGFSASDALGKVGIAFAGDRFALPASGDSPQAPGSKTKAPGSKTEAPGSKPKALSSGSGFAGERFALPASGDSPQAPGSKTKALSSGFGFGFSVPVTPSVTHEFSAAAEGLVNPVDKLVDERIKQINEEQLKVLQDIAANTKERGLTWQ